MATVPTFASTPRYGSVQITSALAANTASAAAITGVAAGTRVREIRVCSGPTTAPGGTYKVKVHVGDGTNDRIVDVITLANTTDTLQGTLTFSNLILPSTSHTIKFSVSTAIAAGSTLDCTVQGEDLT